MDQIKQLASLQYNTTQIFTRCNRPILQKKENEKTQLWWIWCLVSIQTRVGKCCLGITFTHEKVTILKISVFTKTLLNFASELRLSSTQLDLWLINSCMWMYIHKHKNVSGQSGHGDQRAAWSSPSEQILNIHMFFFSFKNCRKKNTREEQVLQTYRIYTGWWVMGQKYIYVAIHQAALRTSVTSVFIYSEQSLRSLHPSVDLTSALEYYSEIEVWKWKVFLYFCALCDDGTGTFTEAIKHTHSLVLNDA